MSGNDYDEKTIFNRDDLLFNYIDSFSQANHIEQEFFHSTQKNIFEDREFNYSDILYINLEKIPTKKNIQFTLTKRGRKKIDEKAKEIKNYYCHNKFSPDNLLKRIQTHYITFIIDYSNEIIHKFGYKGNFIQPNSIYKKNVKKEEFLSLQDKNISYFLSLDITPKFKTVNIINNKILYEEVIKIPIIKKLFEEKYLSLFKNIYHKNKRYIKLENGDINDIIFFSEKVKTYDALLAKIRLSDKMDEENTKLYIQKLNDCIKKQYLSKDNEIPL